MFPFWKITPLNEMSQEQWESLCDGCAQCCIIKFEDEDTGRIYHTNVVCELLDIYHCICTRYRERSVLVPTCLTLNAALIHTLKWMPDTCAYRLLAKGKDLPDWHPLVSGSAESVHSSGHSVRARVVSARDIDEEDLPDYVIDDEDEKDDFHTP